MGRRVADRTDLFPPAGDHAAQVLNIHTSKTLGHLTIRGANRDDAEAVAHLEAALFKPPAHRPWKSDEIAADIIAAGIKNSGEGSPKAGLRRLFLVAEKSTRIDDEIDDATDDESAGKTATGAADGAAEKSIVGYALFHAVADEAELLRIAVSPRDRRRGVARALLKEALTQLTSQGANSIFLEVRHDNIGAIAFYERLGFNTVGHRAAYYPDGSDALVMRLESSRDAKASSACP